MPFLTHCLPKNLCLFPKSLESDYQTELIKISAASGDYSGSRFLKIDYFPYSEFKPRGYYTREDTLKRYFKAMMWMQNACFCREDKDQLKKALVGVQLLLLAKDENDLPLVESYKIFYKTISFFVGEPDALSFLDIVNLTSSAGSDFSKILDDTYVTNLSEKLSKIAKTKNRIIPKMKFTCEEKIHFIPSRYVFDNEILLNMADTTINAKRAYPRGLDIFAALGNNMAKDILINQYKENQNWNKFEVNLEGMRQKMNSFDKWNTSVYNKWFDCLKELADKEKGDLPLLKTIAWQKKNLHTALASWTELKHDAVLYSKEPSMAESGAGGMVEPPPSIVKGYVEPNSAFWIKLKELFELTQKTLSEIHYTKDKITAYNKTLEDDLDFLLRMSEMELKNKTISDKDYNNMRGIGGTLDEFTLQIVKENADSWQEVLSPDTTVSVVADVFLRNIPNCPKNGVLYEGVGKVHTIYVVVPIDGFLYLTRGAVLSYYEFIKQGEDRLTDENWQKMIGKETVPQEEEWFEDYIVTPNMAPKLNTHKMYQFRYNLMGEWANP